MTQSEMRSWLQNEVQEELDGAISALEDVRLALSRKPKGRRQLEASLNGIDDVRKDRLMGVTKALKQLARFESAAGKRPVKTSRR